MRAATSRSPLVTPSRKDMIGITNTVMAYIAAVDALMKQPHSDAREKKLAFLVNQLEIENDRARYFSLGVDWRKDKKEPLKR